MQVGAGARPVAAQRRVDLAVVVPAGWQRRGGGVGGQRDRVVLQVLPDRREVGHRVDAQGAQLRGGADARQHQQLR